MYGSAKFYVPESNNPVHFLVSVTLIYCCYSFFLAGKCLSRFLSNVVTGDFTN